MILHNDVSVNMGSGISVNVWCQTERYRYGKKLMKNINDLNNTEIVKKNVKIL